MIALRISLIFHRVTKRMELHEEIGKRMGKGDGCSTDIDRQQIFADRESFASDVRMNLPGSSRPDAAAAWSWRIGFDAIAQVRLLRHRSQQIYLDDSYAAELLDASAELIVFGTRHNRIFKLSQHITQHGHFIGIGNEFCRQEQIDILRRSYLWDLTKRPDFVPEKMPVTQYEPISASDDQRYIGLGQSVGKACKFLFEKILNQYGGVEVYRFEDIRRSRVAACRPLPIQDISALPNTSKIHRTRIYRNT